jgi:hypothetical protein
MEQAHEPADAEQSGHKASEAVDAVADPLPIGPFRNQSQDDAGYEREENGGFKVIEV